VGHRNFRINNLNILPVSLAILQYLEISGHTNQERLEEESA
jgi:hypothetical protein